jgi:hypothetical protein
MNGVLKSTSDAFPFPALKSQDVSPIDAQAIVSASHLI